MARENATLDTNPPADSGGRGPEIFGYQGRPPPVPRLPAHFRRSRPRLATVALVSAVLAMAAIALAIVGADGVLMRVYYAFFAFSLLGATKAAIREFFRWGVVFTLTDEGVALPRGSLVRWTDITGVGLTKEETSLILQLDDPEEFYSSLKSTMVFLPRLSPPSPKAVPVTLAVANLTASPAVLANWIYQKAKEARTSPSAA
ncbi:hypothetical protein UCD39_17465 [Nitrospirillum sp. BR 11752]|uniref:hypothetical protein n=1 Tax=Nitrospirillum sp. BR 11752 TaxID=3104293 RepID=UPI002EC831CF|nr:hypothetical protein [Nitrospirillum sp. BR 11752]